MHRWDRSRGLFLGEVCGRSAILSQFGGERAGNALAHPLEGLVHGPPLPIPDTRRPPAAEASGPRRNFGQGHTAREGERPGTVVVIAHPAAAVREDRVPTPVAINIRELVAAP